MNESQIKKRKRSANFSGDEKMELIQIISKYKDIIENKKTDHISVNEKNKAWEKVAHEFNAIAPDSNYRDAEVIRRFYENKKKEVRKIAAYEKQCIRKTGGGPPPDIKRDPFLDFILNIINEKTVYGLKNLFDSDMDNQENLPETVEHMYELNRNSYNNTPDLECIEAIEEEICTNEPATSLVEENNTPSTSNISQDWTKVTPKDLQKKPSTPLRSIPNGIERRNLKRKRPATVVKALTSSNIAEKYNELIDKRLQIAERTDNEFNQKTKEHLKRLELLDLKIAIKKKQLNCFEK